MVNKKFDTIPPNPKKAKAIPVTFPWLSLGKWLYKQKSIGTNENPTIEVPKNI